MNTTVKAVVALIGWLRRILMPSFVVEIPRENNFLDRRESGDGGRDLE
jgi:hypothetical protein